MRAALGLAPEHEVIGIVARVQPHRRFDLLLAAAQRLFAQRPAARLLIVGRGTQREALAERPARALGIADRVVFAGYRHHDYADVLRAIDVFTFLVPGSDGSCRALLEAMACGIPAVTTRRGALAEIVADGRDGPPRRGDAGVARGGLVGAARRSGPARGARRGVAGARGTRLRSGAPRRRGRSQLYEAARRR